MGKSKNLADLGSHDVIDTHSTGMTVTGTVASDGLTVDGSSTINGIVTSSTTTPRFRFDETDTTDLNSEARVSAGTFQIRTANDAYDTFQKRFDVDNSTGDISFYEDTGVSPKFFWDASAESLGIGTTAFPSLKTRIAIQGTQGASGSGTNVAADEFFIDNDGSTGMTLGSAVDGVGYYAFADPDVAIRGGIFYDHSSDEMGFRVSSDTRMSIDSSGNVGIGTVPAAKFHVKVTGTNNLAGALIEGTNSGSSSAPDLALYRNSASPADNDVVGALWFYGNNSAAEQTSYAGILTYSDDVTDGSEDGSMRFLLTGGGSVNNEAMRIDGSGNLLVGKTTSDFNSQGFEINSGGQLRNSRASGAVAFLNRKTDNGSIVDFGKDGSVVGSIATHDTRLAIGSDDTYIMFDSGSSPAVWPSSGSGGTDGIIGIGDASRRFKDAHFSGTVNAGSFAGDGSNLTGVGGSTSAGAVGTYMWARGPGSNVATSAFNFGSTYAGSGLYPAGFASQAAGSLSNSWYYSSGYGVGIGPTSTAARSGTWRCMGQTPTPSFDEMPTALFVRIS